MYLKSSVFFVLVAATYLQVSDAGVNPQQVLVIKTILTERCNKYSTNATIVRELMRSIDDLVSKSDSVYNNSPNNRYGGMAATGNLDDVSVAAQQVCDERADFTQAMDKAMPMLTECLSKTEKYIPPFIEDAIVGLLNFTCDDKGENLKKLTSESTKKCFERVTQPTSSAAAELKECTKDMPKPDLTSDTFMAKNDLCHDLSILKKCFGQVIRKHCSNDNSLPALNAKFFDAISQPCAGCLLVSNAALLAVLASVIVKFFY